ncbi:DCC1-like thiol-disulfide oxidoreductase family protein [Bdellovibrio bacteriovorus]|uniref:DCC1-like thiol-disulfide oxidoreductase family protein n=1 Tax=Bdellovibrio bacteriovorus TaxID=959 RepID=UPI0035A97BB6
MRNVVFFDGVCHLCNGFVDAVISRDKTHHLLFCSPSRINSRTNFAPLKIALNWIP